MLGFGMTISKDTGGVFTIAPTPFLKDGALDHASLRRMTEFYLERKVDGITVLGIMGEAHKLEYEESVAVVREVIATAPKLPVVVGVSAPGFSAIRRLAGDAMALGAAGVMITPPPSMRTDDQIAGYIRQAIGQIGTDVPVVLQDHPTATGVIMSNTVIRRIITENASVVMLKHEDWPGLEKITTLRDWQAAGQLRPISILCGNGALFLDCEMGRGADGAMTGYAFPELLTRLVALSPNDREAAQDLFDLHLPLLRYEHQSGIGLSVRKYVLMRRGAITHDTLRAPGPVLSPQAKAEIEFLLHRLIERDPACAAGLLKELA
jgi:4-hydroxy-tetrahydrodipicolinate synthase